MNPRSAIVYTPSSKGAHDRAGCQQSHIACRLRRANPSLQRDWGHTFYLTRADILVYESAHSHLFVVNAIVSDVATTAVADVAEKEPVDGVRVSPFCIRMSRLP